MDHDFCVKNQQDIPNVLPEVYLTTLTITAMQYCGRIPGKPCAIKLHPHFNAIIGGRGSGKSTLLESIRIVSRREQGLDKTIKLKENLDSFKNGVMLLNTELLLNIHRHGKEYRLRWRHNGQGNVL
ncbi:MAG: histidinol phosphatase, partial [Chloroflexi bacterium]|nr:histidinol phosphatase [Chloroflexota bacterium]